MRYEFRKPAFSYQTPITMYTRNIGIAGLFIGTLFKVMHWPGANIISVISGVLVVAATVFIVLTKPKPWVTGELLRSLIGILLVTFLLLKVLHIPFSTASLGGATLALVALFVVERQNFDPRKAMQLRSPWLIGPSAILFVLGTLFKVMHWPGASVMLVLGMTGCAVWFLVPQTRKLANA
ncbi:MAG: hypothetical protein IPH05_10590 [Flavobacteriales bacterium]|jgi:hypothetical protein|nr:hypothetical protein [Flavobacteriales bacterium]MBK7113882.1 hypothetical protein [Flavobacteriales bacterium]MBK9627336.1 hypothetical protein [Flavobacteriales bacterium]MBP8877706.1 hypothetical protein [Flavobacteriales bacterium]MBP9177713.1 hypothetical protein [Flavobacteriales bacterium]